MFEPVLSVPTEKCTEILFDESTNDQACRPNLSQTFQSSGSRECATDDDSTRELRCYSIGGQLLVCPLNRQPDRSGHRFTNTHNPEDSRADSADYYGAPAFDRFDISRHQCPQFTSRAG